MFSVTPAETTLLAPSTATALNTPPPAVPEMLVYQEMFVCQAETSGLNKARLHARNSVRSGERGRVSQRGASRRKVASIPGLRQRWEGEV